MLSYCFESNSVSSSITSNYRVSRTWPEIACYLLIPFRSSLNECLISVQIEHARDKNLRREWWTAQ